MRRAHYPADSRSEGTAKRKSMHQLPKSDGLQVARERLLHMALHMLRIQRNTGAVHRRCGLAAEPKQYAIVNMHQLPVVVLLALVPVLVPALVPA